MPLLDKLTSKLDQLGLKDKLDQDSSQPTSSARDYGSYGQNPVQSSAAPPVYQTPPGQPPLPPGWVPQFDQNHQRWYYAETATGRTQWEAPSLAPSFAPTGAGGPAPPLAPPDQDNKSSEKPKKEKNHKLGMAMGAAGVFGLGAAGGALLEHARRDSESSSDEEGHHHTGAPPPMPPSDYGGYTGGGYDRHGQDTVVVENTYVEVHEDGSSRSSSDAESLQEAREDYEEALEDAQDSDASSSEEEELEEAAEEYEEEYEEEFDDE